jgi:hypothetical protein
MMFSGVLPLLLLFVYIDRLRSRSEIITMADSDPNEVLLTVEQIRQWMDEYKAIGAERARLNAVLEETQKGLSETDTKLITIAKKLRLAAPFYPKISEWLEEEEFNTPDSVALTLAILTALAHHPVNTSISRNVLQQTVGQFGYPPQKLLANPNYLSIALKRLITRQLIEEAAAQHFKITPVGRAEAAKG